MSPPRAVEPRGSASCSSWCTSSSSPTAARPSSAGQRQRTALACALAVEPAVLLLDEPFGGLDAQVRKELRAWRRRLHDEVHVTTVFVTHDQEEARKVADSIVVMAEGWLRQVGPPDELYDRPASEFVMRFLGTVTTPTGRLVRPHDLGLSAERTDGAVEAVVVRVVRLGFEVRVERRWTVNRTGPRPLGTERSCWIFGRATPSTSTCSGRPRSPGTR